MKDKKKRLQDSKVLIILSLIVLVSLLVRLYFFVGVNLSDTFEYIRILYTLDEEFDLNELTGVFGSRIMLIFPLYILVKVFGMNVWVLVSQSLIFSLLLIPLVYKISRLYYDEDTSLLAAFFISLVPFNIIWATWIMPDIPLEFYMTLSAFFLLRGLKDGQNMSFNLLISGLVSGIAYLVKLSGAFFIFVVIAIGLYRYAVSKRIEIGLGYFVLGFLIIFTLQITVYLVHGINPADNFKAIQDYYNANANRDFLIFYPRILFSVEPDSYELNLDRFMGDFKFIRAPLYGFYGYVIVLSLLYILLRKDKSTVYLLIWFFVLAFYLNFGLQSISPIKFLHRDARYLSILMPVASILMSRAMIMLYRSSERGRLFIQLLIFSLILSSLFVTYRLWLFDSTRTYGMHEAAVFLNDKQGVVYASELARYWIDIYSGGDSSLEARSLKNLNCKKVSDAYILLDNLRPPKAKKLIASKKCLRSIPDAWTKVFDSVKKKNIRDAKKQIKKNQIARKSVIYYVP